MTTETPQPGPATTGVGWWRPCSPSTPAALGVFAVGGADERALDETLDRLGVGRVGVGEVVLRRIAGIDTGLVARWTPTRADLFPHAGGAVMRGLGRALTERGLVHADRVDPRELFPEAGSLIEARVLEALARDPSPRATDLLLDQVGRWEGLDQERESEVAPRALDRLLRPALVVSLGRANIGKSSLANALARREAALVADVPGTTRDHVGLTLSLDGLVVRFLDTPGVARGEEADPLTARGAEAALTLAASADLILDCRDAGEPEDGVELPVGVPALRVLLRGDRVEAARSGLVTSAATGAGLGDLAVAIRRALVSDGALADPRPWRFWEPA